MRLNDFIFFSITFALLLIALVVVVIIFIEEYCRDLEDRQEGCILGYLGWGVAFYLLVSFCLFLVLMLFALIMGIDSYSFSYLGKFLNSEIALLFELISVCAIGIGLCVCFKRHDILNIFRYDRVCEKCSSVEDALDKAKRDLKKIESQIKDLSDEKSADKRCSEKVLKELKSNRDSLKKINDEYLVKLSHLQHIKSTLSIKMLNNNSHYIRKNY